MDNAVLIESPYDENLDNIDLRQLAQICINGEYMMDVFWRFETNEVLIQVQVEMLWFAVSTSDNISTSLASVLQTQDFKIVKLKMFEDGYEFFSGESEHGIAHREWMYYASKGYVMQMNLSMGTTTFAEMLQSIHDLVEYDSD